MWLGTSIEASITVLNLEPFDDFEASFMTPNMNAVVGDGTQLPYADKEFDIVFSNSVIEHLGTADRQEVFAREAQRVGRKHWIQTPAKEFPVEPHYFALGLHWFPKAVQKRLLRNFSLWGLLGRPNEAILDRVLAELRLLNSGQFRALFPASRIWTERLMGLPKSYTAFNP